MSRGLASIVVAEAVTAPEALAVVALAAGSVVSDLGSPRAHVRLAPDVVATVETPKFGEAPPLTIDVASERGDADARRRAEALAKQLAASANWELHVIGGSDDAAAR